MIHRNVCKLLFPMSSSGKINVKSLITQTVREINKNKSSKKKKKLF